MTDEKDDAAEARREKYGHQPPPVRFEDTLTSQETKRPAVTTPQSGPETAGVGAAAGG
jgi:hypothetical protein